MLKRYMILNCTQEEVKYRLRLQMSPHALGGWVDNSQFKIFKHLSGIFAGKSLQKLLYCFYGEFHQAGKQTQLIYQVRPGLFIGFLYSLIGFVMLGTLIQFLFMDGTLDTVIFSLAFLLIYFCIEQIQKKKCIADFQAELTAEIAQKNRRHL